MRRICPGEGQKFFPYFFINAAVLPGLLIVYLFFLTPPSGAQSDSRLSRFDRLAQEASELNQAREYEKVIALLNPKKMKRKTTARCFSTSWALPTAIRGDFPNRSRLIRPPWPENRRIRASFKKTLGDVFYFQKEYERAIEQYQQVVRSNPRFQDAYFGLGAAYYKLGKYSEALPHFETALRLDPRDQKAREFRDATLKKLKGK